MRTLRELVFRTLLLLIVLVFFAAFVAIFYPDTIPWFGALFQVSQALLGTPLLLLLLAVFLLSLILPRRR